MPRFVEDAPQAVLAIAKEMLEKGLGGGMVAVAQYPAKALHITAPVERSAETIWGTSQLGEVHHLPEKVDESFACVYQFMRTM